MILFYFFCIVVIDSVRVHFSIQRFVFFFPDSSIRYLFAYHRKILRAYEIEKLKSSGPSFQYYQRDRKDGRGRRMDFCMFVGSEKVKGWVLHTDERVFDECSYIYDHVYVHLCS